MIVIVHLTPLQSLKTGNFIPVCTEGETGNENRESKQEFPVIPGSGNPVPKP